MEWLGALSVVVKNMPPTLANPHVNERQITHLIGAQPVLESYDVYICFWTFPMDIAQ